MTDKHVSMSNPIRHVTRSFLRKMIHLFSYKFSINNSTCALYWKVSEQRFFMRFLEDCDMLVLSSNLFILPVFYA